MGWYRTPKQLIDTKEIVDKELSTCVIDLNAVE